MKRFVDIFDADSGDMAAQVRGHRTMEQQRPGGFQGGCGVEAVRFGTRLAVSLRTPPLLQCLRATLSSKPAMPLMLPLLQLSSERMTAIASRSAVHPVLPVLASATNSGRVHLYR